MKEKRFTYPSQPLSQKKVAKFAEAIETENNESPNTYLHTIVGYRILMTKKFLTKIWCYYCQM